MFIIYLLLPVRLQTVKLKTMKTTLDLGKIFRFWLNLLHKGKGPICPLKFLRNLVLVLGETLS